jgi:hypothetical protein
MLPLIDYDKSHSAPTVPPDLNEAAPTWQQNCCHKIQSTVNPENPVCSATPFNPVPALIHALLNYGHWQVCVNGHWMSDVAGHDNPVHFNQEELLFSCTNTAPVYELSFHINITSAMMLACGMWVHSCAHTPIKGCTNLGHQVTRVTKVAPSICGS